MSMTWPEDSLLLRLHAVPATNFIAFSASYLRAAGVLFALAWLTYRAWQVLLKPAEELVNVLGLEVPQTPNIALSGIKSDGVILHWKPPEHKNSSVSYQIHINGVNLGNIPQGGPSIAIHRLKALQYYTIRVVAVSSNGFHAPSGVIRVRTKPYSATDSLDDNFEGGADGDGEARSKDGDESVVVRLYKPIIDAPVASTPPPMTREHSSSISHIRRAGRRSSPAAPEFNQDQEISYDDGEETIKTLTEKLEGLRKQLEDEDFRIAEEEKESLTTIQNLSEERDQLRMELKERDDSSKSLKKELKDLSYANTQAQQRKTNQEKLLQQKQSQRTKIVEDTERWQEEITRILNAIEKDKCDIVALRNNVEIDLRESRDRQAEEQASTKELEERIHELGIQIKTLDEERTENATSGTPEEPALVDPNPAEDQQWFDRVKSLQTLYMSAWMKSRAAEEHRVKAQQQYEWLTNSSQNFAQPFIPSTAPDTLIARRNSTRARRASSHGLYHDAPFALGNNSFNNSISSVSPTFASPPFFNPITGPSLPSVAMHLEHLPPSDIDQITSGAPMSPAAGALLPSGLLGDDIDQSRPGSGSNYPAIPGLGALPGLGAPETLDVDDRMMTVPSSPGSMKSRSPSVFASPKDSTGHLQQYGGAVDNLDADRRSTRSAASSRRAASGHFPSTASSSRFMGLFSRSRAKTSDQSEDGPALGSLKGSQTQSMPREDLTNPEPIGAQRRRGSLSSSWMGSLQQPFRSSTSRHGPSSSDASGPDFHPGSPESGKEPASRHRTFGVFRSKAEPWMSSPLAGDDGKPPSPRSTISSEGKHLPRPSLDSRSRFGWPTPTVGSQDVFNTGQRPSPLVMDWGNGLPSAPWSQHPSRRPSAQYPPGSLLQEDEAEGGLGAQVMTRSPTQSFLGPIGTRPSSQPHPIDDLPRSTTGAEYDSESKSDMKLNPTAKDFKSLFTRDRKGEKPEKSSEKSKSKSKDKDKDKTPDKLLQSTPSIVMPRSIHEMHSTGFHDPMESPPESRKSRDAHSISTAAESVAESSQPRESLERTTSGSYLDGAPLTPSASTSGKESLMQKLSRKSSSGKFFPAFGKDKSGLFSREKKSSEIGTPDETDEDAKISRATVPDLSTSPNLSGTVGGGRASGLSWSSLKRIGKKNDKAPSVSESIASQSEVGDDEEFGLRTDEY
ncbi:hypothetical protein P152DRAFT_507689 [Eremomyces bilateralis CBS 781.70]|uniref:Fibronectin type-III domain-containing protein n=1 Tax=Eremomyces bilateralis CBS 781.70 TaxID=1392243 RepID=A0A6G1G327_9PEZI|nr:uncharacterized protein P152DRAFT_507689 [Eremomyces bilateralis CBS 781.70]KAF1812418.1 hypothetical protein P152DRAFT_507689 [Eremomyces bilateralis CBS 781.70]